MYIGCCMTIAMVYALAIGVIAMGGKMKKKCRDNNPSFQPCLGSF